jgi:hypothetical protein
MIFNEFSEVQLETLTHFYIGTLNLNLRFTNRSLVYTKHPTNILASRNVVLPTRGRPPAGDVGPTPAGWVASTQEGAYLHP